MAWFKCMGTSEGDKTYENYTVEQGSTFTTEDATSVNTENGKLYMFFTGNHSGSFTNADLLVGDTIYFEILDGIGVTTAIIQATSDTVTYDGAYTGGYSLTEIDILKNEVEDLTIDCLDESNSWVSGTSISANVGDCFLIADTVDNDSGTVIGADVLIEETLTQSPTALNIKIRIIKATATTISLSSGNGIYYRKFGLRKEIKLDDISIPSNCRVAQGSFTSPSVIDDTITINCGFEPDFIKVLMDFGNSQTTAYYFKTDNEDNEEISVWDLRPTESAIYQIFDPSGSVTNETGICEITANGFKYKAHGSNTTDKACTYIAYKFDATQSIRLYTNSRYYDSQEQITDVSGFTKLYSTSSSVDYGSRGSRVETDLGRTDESAIASYMNNGWQDGQSCYYDSENHLGAYAGYDFGEELTIIKVKIWLGRYSGQNKNIPVVIQYLDSNSNWNDIQTVTVTTNLPYPVNVFEIDVNLDVYGIRWIHETETKSSGNNICFFGMTLYRGIGDYIDVFVPETGLNEIPDGYDGFGPVVI